MARTEASMDYFSPGLRETLRVSQRVFHRARRWLDLRALKNAETHLGLLGWQQADFDPETQRQVDAIQHVEKEQSGLQNQAAELARKLQELKEEHARTEAGLEKAAEPVRQSRTKAAAERAEAEKAAQEVDGRAPLLERRTAALDQEERQMEALYRQLLTANPETPSVRNEISRVRERILAIQNERTDLRPQVARLSEDGLKAKGEIARLDGVLSECDRELKSIERQMAEEARSYAARVRDLEKAKAQVEAEVDQLERAKLDPYREIGRVLADSGVAPVNQPDALSRVYDLRKAILGAEEYVGQSLAQTAAEDQQMLRISLGLWGVIVVSALLILGALL